MYLGLGIPKLQTACIIVCNHPLASGLLEEWGLGIFFFVLIILFRFCFFLVPDLPPIPPSLIYLY